MHLRCPHCQQAIELLPEEPQASSLSCPTCGSRLDFLRETVPFDATRPTRIGQFELLEHVGRGQFGDVWKARDTELERVVAVKIPRMGGLGDDVLQLFLREARAAAQLKHPNIVPVHEVGRDSGTAFIVSDFVEGVTLKHVLTHRRPDPRQSAEVCLTLADALQHAHDAGVVHRDLKPGNVMVDSDDRPHIMDFGLAKRDAGEITVTLDGQVLGTPAYMSPEQARGEAHQADRRSDVYSLGVMLYELLTGELPFRGGSTMLIQQILSNDPRPPRKLNHELPRDLETICLRAMAKEPERRYQHAREMALDLRRFLDGQPILARPAGRIERAWRWTRRNRAKTVAAGTTLLSLVLLLALLVFRGAAQPPAPEPPEKRMIVLETEPAGARAVFVPIREDDWEPLPERAVRPDSLTPLETLLDPGLYLVVVQKDGYGFHEVYRTVPPVDRTVTDDSRPFTSWSVLPDGRVALPRVQIRSDLAVIATMVRIEGGPFTMGDARWPALAPEHARAVEDFYLTPTEVTVGQFREQLDGWPSAFERLDPRPGDDAPMTMVSFFDAMKFAETAGMRLPTEAEYEFAATNRGTTAFPWGDEAGRIDEWKFDAVGQPAFDQTRTTPAIRGLYSGVVEWTLSPPTLYPGTLDLGLPNPMVQAGPHVRIVRGGPPSVVGGKPHAAEVSFGPRFRHAVDQSARHAGLGFRCARSAGPRFLNGPR